VNLTEDTKRGGGERSKLRRGKLPLDMWDETIKNHESFDILKQTVFKNIH